MMQSALWQAASRPRHNSRTFNGAELVPKPIPPLTADVRLGPAELYWCGYGGSTAGSCNSNSSFVRCIWQTLRTKEVDMECLTLSIARTCEVLGVGRTTVYSKISSNELVVVKIGRRTLITTASVKALVGL